MKIFLVPKKVRLSAENWGNQKKYFVCIKFEGDRTRRKVAIVHRRKVTLYSPEKDTWTLTIFKRGKGHEEEIIKHLLSHNIYNFA